MRRQKLKHQSIVTNGVHLPDVDGRTSDARRYRDLISAHSNDLGGDDQLSEGQRALIRRAACITVELERIEQQFVQKGGASQKQLETYQRAVNTLRRLFEALRIHRGRVAKDVTPDLQSYIANKKRNGHTRTNRVRVIDHDD